MHTYILFYTICLLCLVFFSIIIIIVLVLSAGGIWCDGGKSICKIASNAPCSDTVCDEFCKGGEYFPEYSFKNSSCVQRLNARGVAGLYCDCYFTCP